MTVSPLQRVRGQLTGTDEREHSMIAVWVKAGRSGLLPRFTALTHPRSGRHTGIEIEDLCERGGS